MALKQFIDSIIYDGEHYWVRWPWKNCEFDLPDNYDVAYGQINSLSKQFQADRNLSKLYDNTIQLAIFLATGVPTFLSRFLSVRMGCKQCPMAPGRIYKYLNFLELGQVY